MVALQKQKLHLKSCSRGPLLSAQVMYSGKLQTYPEPFINYVPCQFVIVFALEKVFTFVVVAVVTPVILLHAFSHRIR